MLTFEILATSEPMIDFHIARARIPGGWLVYITHSTSNEAGCCFVPDARHEWDGSSMPPKPGAKIETTPAGSGIELASL